MLCQYSVWQSDFRRASRGLDLVMPSETSCADQSVEELRRELAEAREQQTATAEILRVISGSPTDMQGVFQEIAASAARLCDAYDAVIRQVDGEVLRLVAHFGPIPSIPVIPLRGTVPGRAALERRTVHIADLQTETEEYPEGSDRARRLGFRTMLGVPLIRASEAIGTISIRRAEARRFTDRQIDLLRTFADQAVIAIENTRLIEEVQARNTDLRVALEQQTATSELLKVIGRSTFNLQPVFETLAANAVKLCEAEHAFIFRFDGRFLRSVATHNIQAALKSYVEANPVQPGRGSGAGRAALERRTIQIEDIRADPEFTYGATQVGPMRTLLAVPMLRAGEVLGVIVITRPEVRLFTENHIALMETFADQAVIAIENTRLFEAEQTSKRELQQSLEYQTAISDVLGVIGRSKFDLQPVLTAIVSTACRLCDAQDARIALRQGEWLEFAAWHGYAWIGTERLPVAPGLVGGRAILERKPIHIHDLTNAGDEFAPARELAISRGHRTALAVPLLREDQAIGCIFLRRNEVRPFTDKQIALLATFADQAVIAIENVRLFEEIAQKSRELEIASQHKSQFVANMSHELRTPLAAILGYAELMQEGFYEPLGQKSLDALTRVRSNGKHLLGLINTVLDIAKIESGQFTLNMAEYAIESVVETVRSATESLAQNKKLALKTEVAKSMPIGLGDEQRLTQVLLNLVGNAIKFTDAGEVCVTAKAINGHFNVSVSDTGPGIPEEHQARIFEQFHQVDSSSTKAKGGTGLGLAIAKQIVEMHGGRIWVESMLGKGSAFQIELPTRAELRKPALSGH